MIDQINEDTKLKEFAQKVLEQWEEDSEVNNAEQKRND